MSAVVIHQYDFFQQGLGSAVDDTSDGSLEDGQGLIQVDQHDSDAGQILWVGLL